MKINSLGLRTDLIFNKFSGEFVDRGDYVAIKTPSNPGYFWGNYLIFNKAPDENSYGEWIEVFDREFDYYKEPHHYSFTWQSSDFDLGKSQSFVDKGFDLESLVVLSTNELNPPPHPNNEISIRFISTDSDWEKVYQSQVDAADPRYLNPNPEGFYEFKRSQIKNYRDMVDAGMGQWFGAFIEGELVADLGIYFEDEIARYQSVGTHPDHRRKGICGTLVSKSGQIAKEEFGVETLVMHADENYHAARIYESVGFQPTERYATLCWWKGNK